MKQLRRRRHLRPLPARAQVRQQLSQVRSRLQLFQLEWLAEARLPQPRLPHLRLLHGVIGQMRDEIASLEPWA